MHISARQPSPKPLLHSNTSARMGQKWGFMLEHLTELMQIAYWQGYLKQSWGIFYADTDLDQMEEDLKAIAYCYRKLDALGALGAPSD